MTDTLTKRNRDKARKAFGLVIKKWEDGCLIEFAVPGDTDFLDELIEAILPLLPNEMPTDQKTENKIKDVDDMIEHVNKVLGITLDYGKKKWEAAIKYLIKVKPWDIAVMWIHLNSDELQFKKDIPSIGTIMKDPEEVFKNWMPIAHAVKTDTSYIDYTQEGDNIEEEDTPVPVGAEIPWLAAVSMLELECSPRVMEYINKTKAVRLEEGCLTVSVPDQDTKNWLDSRVRSTAERLMIGICGEKVAVDFVIGA